MTIQLRLVLPQLVCAVLIPAATLPAFQQNLRIDPADTKVEFSLPTMLHTVHGTFALKRATVQFDPSTGNASGELVVDATSGESGSPSRDRRMHNKIIESDKYPAIVFRPDHVEGKVLAQGASQVKLHGTFSLHGADHELSIPLEVVAANGQYTITGHFSIPYVKWGIKDPSAFMLRVNDTVEIKIETVAKVAP